MTACINCDKRTIDCHAYCGKYIEERKDLDKQNIQRKKAKEKVYGHAYIYDNKRK